MRKRPVGPIENFPRPKYNDDVLDCRCITCTVHNRRVYAKRREQAFENWEEQDHE